MRRGGIQLSRRGLALYRLLTRIVLLLVIVGVGFCFSALTQLPASPLADVAEQSTLSQATRRLFELVTLGGLISAGIMLAGAELSVERAPWLGRLWTALVIASLTLTPFDFAGALELAAAFLALIALAASYRRGETSVFLRVWQIGLLLIAVSFLGAQPLAGQALDAARAFRIQVAYPIAGLSVMFWLMRRYSRVDDEWLQEGLRIVAVLVFLAGGLISLGRLGLPPVIAVGAAALVPLCYMILAGHSYRALASRNENATLATHWIALATLFWLVGGGFLGTLSSQPAINAAMRGTDLAAAQDWLARWALLAIVLGFVNEAASTLRGDNQRVTGYTPLWLMVFGVGLAAITQAGRGVVEIYLRRVGIVDAEALRELLLPLTVVWFICLLAVAAGILTYALGFWLRKPRIILIDD